MANENKGTIYQNLNKMLNLDGFGFESEQGTSIPQSGAGKPKIIIKGDSPQDIQRKGLELQQKEEIRSKFFKTTDHGFQKAMQYEAARLPAYLDYEGMEYYPIIASALDLFMEEATTIGSNGQMLNIYSDKDRIKTHLEELFYDVINVNVNLPFWTRNLPIKEDSIIPLLDGTELTIKDISKRLKNNPNEEIWTYSIQDKTKNVVGGKIVWCDLTRKKSQIVKVHLDDGSYVETTADHEFMLRNGTYIQAQNLKKNDSLMPFYTRESVTPKDNINGYEKTYNPSSNHYKYTHNVVAHELHRNLLEENSFGGIFHTHHIDFNKKNNHPNNLKRLSRENHLKLHQEIVIKNLHSPEIIEKRLKGIDKYLRSEKRKNRLSNEMSGIYPKYFKEYNNSELHNEHNIIRSESMLKHWSNQDYNKSTRKLIKFNVSDETFSILKDEIINLTVFKSKSDFCDILKNNSKFVKNLKESNNHIKRDVIKSLNPTTLERFITRKIDLNYLDLIKSLNPKIANTKQYIKAYNISNAKKQNNKILNHKVVAIEFLHEKSDVYCMEVVGKNGEHDRHNFPICSKDSNGNYNRNGVFVSNCKFGDNFVYLLGEKNKGITHVKQLVNYEIERIERINNGKQIVKFKQRETGDEFNIFEIAHFRLLGQDKYLPYGSSMLNKIRRVFRQCLVGDSKIWTPNGYVVIKDINIGDDIYSYDYIDNKVIKTKVSNKSNNGNRDVYKVRTRHREITLTNDHLLLTYNKNNDSFEYKDITKFNKKFDRLVLPPINDNFNDEYTIKTSAENYYVKLNESGIKKSKGIESLGIMSKIDSLHAETTRKNLHTFIKGGDRKIKYLDFIKLCKTFNFDINDVELFSYGRKHKSIVNNKLEYTINKKLVRFFGFMLGDGWIKKHEVGFALGEYNNQNDYYINLAEELSGSKSRTYKKIGTKSAQTVVGNTEFSEILLALDFTTGFNNKKIPDWVFGLSFEYKLEFIKGIFDADGCDNNKMYSSSNRKLIEKLRLLCQTCNIQVGKIITENENRSGFVFDKHFNKIINRLPSYKLYINIASANNNVDFQKIIDIEYVGNDVVWDIEVNDKLHNFISDGLVVHNCVMAEDAMLTYRIIRAGEKRVFKIDVGNIDEDDIEEYIQKVATRFKKQQQVNGHDGQIDYRFNIMGNDEDFFIPVRNANVQTGIDTLAGACLALDTKIDLLDGRSLELKHIIKEYDEGKNLWSYSINPNTGLIVPAPITWAGVTRKNTEVLKLTLDNGETITCTPDHKFPTKYNGTKEAKDLSVGESMWAFNKKEEKIKGGGKRNTYEMIYDHSKQEWVYTHRMIGNYMRDNNLHEDFKYKLEGEKETIHHKDFNRYNNNPDNLSWMNSKDHLLYHRDSQKLMWESLSDEKKENHKKARKIGLNYYWENISLDDLKLKIDVAQQNSLKSRNKAIDTFNSNPNKDKIIELRGKSISKTKSLENNRLKQSTIAKSQWENSNLREILKEKQSIKYSHKLLDLLIEYTNEYSRIDLILEKKINIDDSEWLEEFNLLNNDNKQLKKMSSITRNNINKMLKYFGYTNWRDFKSKIPCYNHKIVDIEWLEEKQDTGTITIDGKEELHDYHNFALSCGIFTKNSNLDQIQDIEYLRDNLFTGLSVPKPFLGFQEAAGDGKNLAQMDVRFLKKINRIQQAMIQELNKMAVIHLFLLGFDKEDLGSFTLSLSNPSTQQQLLNTELMQQQAAVYGEMTRNEGGIAAMSHTRAKRIILNMSDKDIIDDLKMQRMERAIAQELQDSPLVIRKTGIFDDVDEKYGDPEAAAMMSGHTGLESGGMDGGLGGMEGMPEPAGGGIGGEFGSAGALPPVIGQGKGFKENGNVIGETEDAYFVKRNKMSDDTFNSIAEKIVYGDNKMKKKKDEKIKVLRENNDRNRKLNDTAIDMVNEINDLLKHSTTMNENKKLDSKVFDNIDLDIDFEDKGVE